MTDEFSIARKEIFVQYAIHKLYTMTKIDKHTGSRTILYEHATMNVMLTYLQPNVDSGFTVEITAYDPE